MSKQRLTTNQTRAILFLVKEGILKLENRVMSKQIKNTPPLSQKTSSSSDTAIINEIRNLLNTYELRYKHNVLVRIYSILNGHLSMVDKS